MKLRAVAALVPLSLALVLVGTAPPAAAQSTGWIRWGNWSPSAPNFDIYLNSFGGSGMTVIRHVRYGHVSAYRAIPTGQYTVAMRDSGAPASTPPALSASVQIAPEMAYTIVSMGAPSHLGVQVLKESMMSSPGKVLVRVVQESVAQHRVSVNADGRALGGPLQLGSYTGFLALSPGWQAFHATGYSAAASRRLFLRAQHHPHARRARQPGWPADPQPAGRGGQPGHADRWRRDRLGGHRAEAGHLTGPVAGDHGRRRAARRAGRGQAAAKSPPRGPRRHRQVTGAPRAGR